MLKSFRRLQFAKWPWKFPASCLWEGFYTKPRNVHHRNDHGNFQRHVWRALDQYDDGNFHGQNGLQEYLMLACFKQPKMTMEISNVILLQVMEISCYLEILQMTMEISVLFYNNEFNSPKVIFRENQLKSPWKFQLCFRKII